MASHPYSKYLPKSLQRPSRPSKIYYFSFHHPPPCSCFSSHLSPLRCSFIMHDKLLSQGFCTYLPSSWNVLTPDCSNLLPHFFQVSAQIDLLRKAFLYYFVKLQSIPSPCPVCSLLPFAALLFSKAFTTFSIM